MEHGPERGTAPGPLHCLQAHQFHTPSDSFPPLCPGGNIYNCLENLFKQVSFKEGKLPIPQTPVPFRPRSPMTSPAPAHSGKRRGPLATGFQAGEKWWNQHFPFSLGVTKVLVAEQAAGPGVKPRLDIGGNLELKIISDINAWASFFTLTNST